MDPTQRRPQREDEINYIRNIGVSGSADKPSPSRAVVHYQEGAIEARFVPPRPAMAVVQERLRALEPKEFYPGYSEYSEWEREELIPALARRAFHLPGYSACKDWVQFHTNTHPLIGICFHHPKHPVKWPMRTLMLIGSLILGLLVSNIIWLFFALKLDGKEDRAVLTIVVTGLNATHAKYQPKAAFNSTTTNDDLTLSVTEAMVLTWTIGALAHAIYDTTIWFLAACLWCFPAKHRERCSLLRRECIVLFVFALLVSGALTSFLIVIRASLSEQNEDLQVSGGHNNTSSLTVDPRRHSIKGMSSFQFLLLWGVQSILSLFFWYPIIGSLLFSGVLGCKRIPILGGRPYEMRQEEIRLERRKRKQLQQDEATVEDGVLSDCQDDIWRRS